MMISRIAKARHLYLSGRIEVEEFERRVGLALAHDPDDFGEHIPVTITDRPGAVGRYYPSPADDAIWKWLTQPRVYFPTQHESPHGGPKHEA